MTKSWKSHGGLDGCRTFRKLYLSLPNARPVLVKVDLVQADVGATKWVAVSGLIEQPKRASGRGFASVGTRKRPSLNRAAIAFCGTLLAMEQGLHGFGALIAIAA